MLRLSRSAGAQHLVQFYENDSLIIDNVSFLVATALGAGDAAVLVATESHREQIRARLESLSLDLELLRKSGRFVALDATEVLSLFMVNGWPDEKKFDLSVGAVIADAARASGTGFVFAFGEMVDLLCQANNPEAAIRLEQLWNSLAQRHHFSLYCAYSMTSVEDERTANALTRICEEHALTIPTDTL